MLAQQAWFQGSWAGLKKPCFKFEPKTFFFLWLHKDAKCLGLTYAIKVLGKYNLQLGTETHKKKKKSNFEHVTGFRAVEVSVVSVVLPAMAGERLLVEFFYSLPIFTNTVYEVSMRQ